MQEKQHICNSLHFNQNINTGKIIIITQVLSKPSRFPLQANLKMKQKTKENKHLQNKNKVYKHRYQKYGYETNWCPCTIKAQGQN